MALILHNPISEAHLEELRTRLAHRQGRGGETGGIGPEAVERLVGVVREMDRGRITTCEALEAFTRAGVPDFSRWLVDMLDEGVYLDAQTTRGRGYDRAA